MKLVTISPYAITINKYKRIALMTNHQIFGNKLNEINVIERYLICSNL